MKEYKLYNLVNNFAFELDTNVRIKDTTPSDSNPFGFPKKTFIDKPFKNYLPKNYSVIFANYIKKIQPNKPIVFECAISHKNGEKVWYKISIICTITNNEKEYLVHCNNINELKSQLLKSQTTIQELKQANAINHHIINSTQAIILRLNNDGSVASFSKGAEEILGYKSQEILNANWYSKMVSADKVVKYNKDFKAFIKSSKQAFTVTGTVICKNKSHKIISWKASKIIVDKITIGVIAIGKEITEITQKVNLLQESETRFRTLAELVQVPLSFISTSGKIIFINKAYTKEYGFQLHEIPDVKTLLNLCYKDKSERDIALKKWNTELRLIKRNKQVIFNTTIFYTKKGEKKTVEYSAISSNDYIYYSYLDITAHIEKERTLLESKEIFKRIAENTPVPIAGYDALGLKVIFTNKKFTDSVGYSFEEINKMNDWGDLLFYDNLTQKKQLEDEWESVKIELFSNPLSIIKNLERRIACKDGSIRDYEIAITYDNSTIYALFYDITERKKAQEQLLKSEMRFRNLAEEILFPVSFVNIDGKFIFLNKAFTEKFGYTLKDFPNIETVVNKTKANSEAKKIGISNWQNEIKNLFANKNTISNTIDIETKKGEIKQVEYSASLSDDFVFYVYSDITEQRKAELRLKLSEEKFRNIVEYLPIPLVSLNPITGTLISNKKHQELIGHNNSEGSSNSDISNFSINDLVDSKDRKQFVKLINRIKKNNSELPIMQPIYQVKILCKDNQIRTFEITENIYEKTLYTLFHDITDRLKATELLKESEQKFKALAEHMPIAIGGYNADGKVIFLNNYFTKITGYKITDVPTIEDWYKKTQPNKLLRESFYEHWTSIVSDFRHKKITKKPEIKATSLCKNGSFRSFSFSFSIYNDITYILIIDITEEEYAKKELEKSHQELKNLASYLQNIREEERKNISREIHDELGQQITGIKMDVSAIFKKAKPIDEYEEIKRKEVIDAFNNAIKSVRKISIQLRPSILDDLGVIATFEWQISEFKKRTGIKCIFYNNIDEKKINIDLKNNLFRILQESLTNITRHASASIVNIDFFIAGDQIRLIIADNGKGFNQNSSKRTLGLIGMRERASILNGSFVVASEKMKGTRIIISIPLK